MRFWTSKVSYDRLVFAIIKLYYQPTSKQKKCGKTPLQKFPTGPSSLLAKFFRPQAPWRLEQQHSKWCDGVNGAFLSMQDGWKIRGSHLATTENRKTPTKPSVTPCDHKVLASKVGMAKSTFFQIGKHISLNGGCSIVNGSLMECTTRMMLM